jgi:hypothetical protein
LVSHGFRGQRLGSSTNKPIHPHILHFKLISPHSEEIILTDLVENETGRRTNGAEPNPLGIEDVPRAGLVEKARRDPPIIQPSWVSAQDPEMSGMVHMKSMVGRVEL